jgi:hypothetical protein
MFSVFDLFLNVFWAVYHTLTYVLNLYYILISYLASIYYLLLSFVLQKSGLHLSSRLDTKTKSAEIRALITQLLRPEPSQWVTSVCNMLFYSCLSHFFVFLFFSLSLPSFLLLLLLLFPFSFNRVTDESVFKRALLSGSWIIHSSPHSTQTHSGTGTPFQNSYLTQPLATIKFLL